MNSRYRVLAANASHTRHAEDICAEMDRSAQKRGTGIRKRNPEDIRAVMREGRGVIALDEHGNWAGFSYMQGWGKDNKEFVSNSGMIVAPHARGNGLAKKIKQRVFNLSRTKFPGAKVFSITTGAGVMNMNDSLGFKPVTYSELPQENAFWAGCKSCPNYDTLKAKNRKMCFCTAMLFDPNEQEINTAIRVKERRAKRAMSNGSNPVPHCKHMRVINSPSRSVVAR